MAQPEYSTSVQIPVFSGLNQIGDGYNRSMQYAWEMENVNVDGGTFRPMREGLQIPQELENPIGTLAYLYRRFGGTGVAGTTVLVAVANGRVFTKMLDGTDEWTQQYPPLVNTADEGEDPVYEEAGYPLTENDCDWVTYEISKYPVYDASRTYKRNQRIKKNGDIYKANSAINTPEAWNSSHWTKIDSPDSYDYPAYDPQSKYATNDYVMYPAPVNYKANIDIDEAETWNADHWTVVDGTDPVDILLFTNAVDGMFCLYGDTKDVAPVKITPDPENKPNENIKFGVITRYNERIWGTGVITEPDMLMYSVPYDPFDWRQNDEIPEDGAGDIRQPSWDGDSFLALRQHGNALLAVKRNSIWRINGTDPGTFVMTQQYGGGTIEENTLISFNEHVYMLGEHGMLRYDGIGAYAFLQENIHDLVFKHVNHDALDKAAAGMRDGTYCLALPVNGSTFCNAILEYNTYENTFALRTDISVDSFCQIDERLFYTSATQPGKVFELQDRIGMPLPCKYISGYQDLGQKNSIKSAFIVYMMVDSEAPVELRVGIRTEKKLKQKIVYTKPGKMTRLHLNLQGRIFRLEIQSYSAVPFTIAGGVRIDLELDPD